MCRLFLGTVLLSYFIGTAVSDNLPSFIKACKLKDPNLSDCAVKEGNKVMGIISKGVSDIGFPSLVKYQYPDVVYTGPDVKIKFHGGITTGLAGIVVTNIRYDFEKKIVYNTDNFRTLEVNGTYDINGKIFDTAIKATGPFKISMENVELTYKMNYELVDKNGVEYLRNLAQTITLEPQTVRVNFENLFDDVKKTAQFNKKINENKERCVKEIVPSVAKMLDNYVQTHMYEKMIHKIPFNQLFLRD